MLVLALLLPWPAALPAQDRPWSVALTVGRAAMTGTSTDTAATDGTSFGPGSPALITLSLERRWGRWAVGLQGAYGRATLELAGPDLRIEDRATRFSFLEVAPVAGYRLAGLGSEGEFLAYAGPVLARWTLSNQPDRTRLGGLVGLALPLWFGDRVGGVLRLEAVALPSVLEEDELPQDFERSATVRAGLSLGVTARL